MTKSPRKVKGKCQLGISSLQEYRSDDTSAINSNESEKECFSKTYSVTPTKHKTMESEVATSITPPKQKKGNENCAPIIPRTPSSLLNELVLSNPQNDYAKVQPNKLINNVFQNARRALHSYVPSNLPGREKELNELQIFIYGCIENKTSASLYISGPPGTGKTAALSVVLEDMHVCKLQKIFVNCTPIKSSGAIYSRISKELNLKVNGRTEKEHRAAIDDYFKKTHKMILLVLDEIDQLDSKNQSVLYTIFEWPAKEYSKLILIGIANALDLTDRILPRLQTRCELKPKLMHFAPYTKQQIVQIFMERLKESNINNIFSPAAIQMLAGKVAAVSGDVRRALDIGRRVVELTEQHHSKGILQSLENVTLPETKSDESKVIDLKQVLSILNSVYGTSQNLRDNSDDAFPLQQKIIVCSLLLIIKKARNKDVTVGKLHEVYKRVCQNRNLTTVDQAEFVGLCSLVETRGIIQVTRKKEPRLHKVTLVWDEEEVATALKDRHLMSSILQDDKCLGRL